MTRKKKAEIRHERPARGGSYVRDRKTGALTRVIADPVAAEPESAEADEASQTEQDNPGAAGDGQEG